MRKKKTRHPEIRAPGRMQPLCFDKHKHSLCQDITKSNAILLYYKGKSHDPTYKNSKTVTGKLKLYFYMFCEYEHPDSMFTYILNLCYGKATLIDIKASIINQICGCSEFPA